MGSKKEVGIGVIERDRVMDKNRRLNANCGLRIADCASQSAIRNPQSAIFYCLVMSSVLMLMTLAPLADTTPRVLIITGAGGEAAYEKRFQEWAVELSAALRQIAPEPGAVVWLGDPAGVAARRDTVLQALSQLKVPRSSSILVFLIGHASFDGVQYRFNLIGPDITQAELHSALDAVEGKLALVALTSSSGALAEKMARSGRVVLATSRQNEKFPPEFPRFFVASLKDAAADTNKNSEVSVLEAYQYARIKTEEWYRAANRLATEHAVLEDNGDGNPSVDPSSENGEGLLASSIALAQLGERKATRGAADLLEQRRALEAQLDGLKYRKASLPEAEYEAQLQELLVKLAELNRKIRGDK